MESQQVELTLRDYAAVVWERKWIVVIATVLTAVVAVSLSVAQTPVYRAAAAVLVQPRGQDSLFTERLVFNNDRAINTELQVIQGQAVRERVRENLALDRRPSPVRASSPSGSDVVTLTVRSTNAQNAATLANAYADAYIQVRREQSVDELLAATTEIQSAISDLRVGLDGLDDDDPRRGALQAQIGSFNTTLEQLNVDAALRTGGATVLRDANVPSTPFDPTPRRTGLLAAVVGLVLGLAAVLLIDYLDDKIRTEEDLEKVTGQSVLGVVPVDPPPDNRPIALSEPTHFSVEAYRGLRTNLQFLGLDRPLKVIQLTSSIAGEGKTTTACNLAVVLAQAGNRVALVDADLRRPRVHEVFAIVPRGGLTDLLLGADPKSVVNHVDVAGGTRLSVYTSGSVPANPSEMLSGRRARALFNEMAKHYDYVVVDSAPVLPVTDSIALSGAVDGVLVVAHAGRVSDSNAAETVERLDRVNAPVLGLVLNQAANKKNDQYGYGGYSAVVPPAAEPAADTTGEVGVPLDA